MRERMFRVKSREDVAEARKRLNLTQAELAAACGVSVRTVQNWEAGRVPQPKHRRALEHALQEAA